MKTIKILALVLALSMTYSFASAQNKIGHVSYVDVLSLMPETKNVDASLAQLTNDLQEEYNRYVTEYQNKLVDYQQNSPSWSDTKKEAVEADIQSLEQRIQEFQTGSQQKLADKREEMLAPIIEKVNNAIKAIGAENHFTYIMDSGNLVYIGDDAEDVMPLVKAKLNLQ